MRRPLAQTLVIKNFEDDNNKVSRSQLPIIRVSANAMVHLKIKFMVKESKQ
jgi:hypothetical protein